MNNTSDNENAPAAPANIAAHDTPDCDEPLVVS
jgi:hypothetical protein